MKERVRVLSTPARRQAAAESAEATLAAASCAQPPGASVPPQPPAVPAAPHVTFAPGVGGTPMPGQPSAARTPYTANKTPAAAASNGGGVGAGAGIAGGRRRVSVDGLLTEYLRAQGSTPPHLRTEREQRVAALRECPTSAQMWCEFLEGEELALGDETMNGGGGGGGYGGGSGRNGVSLFRLYEHATRSLPQVSRNAPYEKQGHYLRLYLGLARQQMVSNMDDARDTFKYLKSEGFWQQHGMFWTEWAAFGYQYKGEEKALKILTKGVAAGATPISIVEEMKRDIERGSYQIAAPGGLGRGGGDRTGGGSMDPYEQQREMVMAQRREMMLARERERATRAAADAAAEERARLEATVSIPKIDPAGGYGGGYAYMNDENAPPRQRAPPSVAPRTPAAAAEPDDVTMEICSADQARRHHPPQQQQQQRRAAHQPAAPVVEMEDATVVVDYDAAQQQQREQQARLQARAARPQMPRSISAPAAPGATAAASAAAAPAAPAAAAVDEKKKRAKIRENSEMVVVRGVKYLKLECVGQGGTCKVYKVLCPKRKTYALKRIRLQGREKETVAGFLDEIRLLQNLRGKHNIIQLVDAEVCKNEGLIYVVLEYGEIDLARLLSKREKQRAKELKEKEKGKEGVDAAGTAGAADAANNGKSNAGMIDDNFLRLYFEQMVEAVGTIHEQKIVHSDLKPANFLFVEGALKLIDFGIAKQDTSKSDTTNIVRDHQVGTVNYMSPEAILNGQPSALGGPLKVGRASDIWSLGCILYQMVYGQTPFARITGMIPKLHAITDPKHVIPMPPVANPHLTDLISQCLVRHPHHRITIEGILRHPFLRPAAAATPSKNATEEKPASGLSALQLTALLEQIQKHGAGVDVGAVTQEVFRQIAAGETNVSVSPLLRKHAKAPTAAAAAETAAAGTAETAAAAPLTGEQPAAPPKEPAVVEESSVPAATDAVDAMQEGVEAISLNEA